jgi:hypothetical protein
MKDTSGGVLAYLWCSGGVLASLWFSGCGSCSARGLVGDLMADHAAMEWGTWNWIDVQVQN